MLSNTSRQSNFIITDTVAGVAGQSSFINIYSTSQTVRPVYINEIRFSSGSSFTPSTPVTIGISKTTPLTGPGFAFPLIIDQNFDVALPVTTNQFNFVGAPGYVVREQYSYTAGNPLIISTPYILNTDSLNNNISLAVWIDNAANTTFTVTFVGFT